MTGDTTTARKKMSTPAQYNRGSVNYKDIKFGIYKEGKMELMNDGVNLKDRFAKLMRE